MAGAIAEMEAALYPPETVAGAKGIILRPSRMATAATAAEAADNFAVLVEIFEQVCKSKEIEPHNSASCAKRIKKTVDLHRRERDAPGRHGKA